MAPLTARDQSLAHSGMGQQVDSPRKRRRYQRKNEKEAVDTMGKTARLQDLRQKMAALTAGTSNRGPPLEVQGSDGELDKVGQSSNLEESGGLGESRALGSVPDETRPPCPTSDTPHLPSEGQKRSRHLEQEVRVARFFERWQAILPSMQQPLMQYQRETICQPTAATFTLRSNLCGNEDCMMSSKEIVMLFWDRECHETIPGPVYLPTYFTDFETHRISFCACKTLQESLVRSGMFPTAPVDPQMAVSVDLLEFYFALFQRSGDAITAVAGALHAFYERKGFPVNNAKVRLELYVASYMCASEICQGEPIRDPFRKTLSHAVQWYDVLRIRIERAAEAAVHHVKQALARRSECAAVGGSDGKFSTKQETPLLTRALDLATTKIAPPASISGPSKSEAAAAQCAFILQDRCPACFGGNTFGQPLSA